MLNFFISLIIALQLVAPAQGIVAGVQDMRVDFPRREITDSFEPIIEAKSALAMDVKTGKILFQKNGFEQRSLASITKLMTALVFLEREPEWDKQVRVSIDDRQNGGKLAVEPGETIRLEDLFFTALVGSINSATYELARATDLEYQDFINRMNDKAKEIGMENSIFIEPTGISSGNKATAKDVAVLLRVALAQEKIREALNTERYIFKTRSGKTHYINNTNELLESYLDIAGGKTGYIEEAGFCLVNLVKNEQAPEGIIVAILGAETKEARFQQNKFLSQWVFDNWEWE